MCATVPKPLPPAWTAPCTKPGVIDLFPGDGAFGVKDILACLPDPITYCLEIPGDALAAEIGFEEYARRALQTAQKHLD